MARSLSTLTVTANELRNAVTFPNVIAKVVDQLSAHTQALRIMEDRLTILTSHVANDVELPLRRQLQEVQTLLPQLASLESVNVFAEEMRNEMFELSTSTSDRLSKQERLFPRVQDLETMLDEEKDYIHNVVYVHLKECEETVSRHSVLLQDMGSDKDSFGKLMNKQASELNRVFAVQKEIEARQMSDTAETNVKMGEIKKNLANIEKEIQETDQTLRLSLAKALEEAKLANENIMSAVEDRAKKSDLRTAVADLASQMSSWRSDFQELEKHLLTESNEMKEAVEDKTMDIINKVEASKQYLEETIAEDRKRTNAMSLRVEKDLNAFNASMTEWREQMDSEVRAESLRRRRQMSGVEAALVQRIKQQPDKILKRARAQVLELTRSELVGHSHEIDKKLESKLDKAVLEPLLSSKADVLQLSSLPSKADIKQIVMSTIRDYTAKAQRGLSKSFNADSLDRGLVLRELHNAGILSGESDQLIPASNLHGGAMVSLKDDEIGKKTLGSRGFTDIEEESDGFETQLISTPGGGENNSNVRAIAAKVDKWAARMLLVNHDVLRIGSLLAEVQNAVTLLREERDMSGQCMLQRYGGQLRCTTCNTNIVVDDNEWAANSPRGSKLVVDITNPAQQQHHHQQQQHHQPQQLQPIDRPLKTEMERRKLVSSESKRGILSNRFGGKIPNDSIQGRPAPSPRTVSIAQNANQTGCPDTYPQNSERDILPIPAVSAFVNQKILPPSTASSSARNPQPPVLDTRPQTSSITVPRTPKLWFSSDR